MRRILAGITGDTGLLREHVTHALLPAKERDIVDGDASDLRADAETEPKRYRWRTDFEAHDRTPIQHP